jgi:hypothetical protein
MKTFFFFAMPASLPAAPFLKPSLLRRQRRRWIDGQSRSRLRKAQAVLRDNPRTAACSAVVSKPAEIKAPRISASFEVILTFGFFATLPI